MKNLTAAAVAEKDARGNAPVIMVEIDWSGSVTGYYSERPITVGAQDYEGMIIAIGEIREGFLEERTGDLFLEFANTDENRFSNNFLLYEPERRTVRVYQHFENNDDSDLTLIFKGIVESPVKGLTINDERVRVNVLGYERKFQEDIGWLISETDFGYSAHSVRGTMAPVIAGDLTGVDCPCLPVSVPVDTTLTAALSMTAPTAYVDNTAQFPASGTLKIDEEIITYTGKTATTFTGLTRGVGTYAVAHSTGRNVGQNLGYLGANPYVYLAAGHELKAIGNIKADGIAASGAVIELANTTWISGKTLALVRFAGRPVVEDKSAAGNSSLSPTPSGHSASGFQNGSLAYDGDPNTPAWFHGTGSNHLFLLTLKYDNVEYQGKITKKTMTVSWGITGTYSEIVYNEMRSAGGVQSLGAPPLTLYTRTWTQEFGTPSADYGNLEWQIYCTINGFNGWYNIYEMALTVEFEGGGSVTLNPTITCQPQGFKDDIYGSYTGTPNALIEYAPDIMKYLLVVFGGAEFGVDFDATMFAAVKSTLSAFSYKSAFRLTEQQELLKALMDLAYQSFSYLWFDVGVANLKIKALALSSPVKELFDFEDFVEGRCWRGSTDEIVNRIRGKYGPLFYTAPDTHEQDGDDDGWNVLAEISDSTSITAYGEKLKEPELNMVRSSGFATTILTREKDLQKDIHWWLECETPLRDIEIERGDVVRVNFPRLGVIKDLAEVRDITRQIGNGQTGTPDLMTLSMRLELFAAYAVGTWGYIRIANSSWYFVIGGEIVARLASDGHLYLKGFLMQVNSFPATTANPVQYDADRAAIAFGTSANVRVMEIDQRGNLLLLADEMTDQTLSYAGSANSIGNDTNRVWWNVGSARVAEAWNTGYLKLLKDVVENCFEAALYG